MSRPFLSSRASQCPSRDLWRRPDPYLIALILLGIGSRPDMAQGQVFDSVRVQVEATQKTISQLWRPATILIDPRPELRRDSIGAAVLDAFESAGFEYWTSPGIPPPGTLLIAPGRIYSRGDQPMVQTAYHAFGEQTEGDSHTWRNVYHTMFRLDCAWGGGECLVGRPIDYLHGDGHVASRCWEDYFSRTEVERKECWYWL